MPNKIVLTYIHILTLVNKIFDISAIKVKIRSRQINALSLIYTGRLLRVVYQNWTPAALKIS